MAAKITEISGIKAESDRDPRGRFRPGNPGKPPGTKNKAPAGLANMIVAALHNAGGEAYLEGLAHDRPELFAKLLEKVIPTRSENLHDVDVEARVKTRVVFSMDHAENNPEFDEKVRAIEARAEALNKFNGNTIPMEMDGKRND